MKHVLLTGLILPLAACGTEPDPAAESERVVVAGEAAPEPAEFKQVELSSQNPVVFGVEVPVEEVEKEHFEGEGEHEHLAQAELVFRGLPEEEEGESFTLIGGGLNDTGFHGPNSTGFEGIGVHFAEHEDGPGSNPPRDEDYKADYTRTVEDGELSFTLYYEPTNINEWGDRYFPGSELALTMMREGTGERVLYAGNNDLNWSIAGVGEGNRARFVIEF